MPFQLSHTRQCILNIIQTFSDSEEKCMRIKCDPPRKCSLDAQGMPVCICPLFCKHRRAKRSLGMVCGTNNKEYKDRCKLEISACELNQTVSVKQYGACPAMSREYKFLEIREKN